MTLRLNGSTSGYTEIDAPAVAGSNTLVLPTGNGSSGQVLSTNGSGALSWVDRFSAAGPAFSAYLNGTQNISTGTFTKVQFNTEEFDTASCFDNATNYRFQPNIAGYYSCHFLTTFVSSSSHTRSIPAFYKNGSILVRMHDINLSFGTTRTTFNGTHLMYLNGSTDYAEVYFYVEGTGTLTLGSSSSFETCYFQAHLARPA